MKIKTRGRARYAAGFFDELVIDNFAGGGGASMGMEQAIGRAVDLAINHDPEAVALHQANHPATEHACENVWKVDPVSVTRGRPVGLAWFSPDCKHFSRAKGGKPVEKKIRGLAWVVIKWAKLVRPRIIMLENVREFEDWGPLGADARPCPRRKGLTFRRWVGCLRNLGYDVEWRSLNAADFGAPTHRRRLFLIARLDGESIVWPEPSHGPGRKKPWRAAAECIDFSLPCPSIFLTREEARPLKIIRPLAEKTMRRIALGLKRYVLDNPKPFIVRVDHGGNHFRGQPLSDPLSTVTGKHGFGLVSPFLTAQYGERPGQQPRSHRIDEPIPTVTPREGGGFPLIVPHLTKFFGGVVGQEVVKPAPTVTAVDHTGLVTATLAPGSFRGQTIGAPLGTITSVARPTLIAPTLIQYNQEKGTETRAVNIEGPVNVITPANRFALAAANLIKMNFGDKQWNPLDEPLRTILAGANHHGLVSAFLVKYFGRSTATPVDGPIPTITPVERFGLVQVENQDYAIADIGLRMLTPRELYRAQGFPESYRIDVTLNGRKLPKSAQVRMCGNSVSPAVARALVQANFKTSAVIEEQLA